MQDAVVLNNGLGPQVQTLLSMLGLQQEERVVHPRVRDIDSRYNSDDGDNIKIHDHNIIQELPKSLFRQGDCPDF